MPKKTPNQGFLFVKKLGISEANIAPAAFGALMEKLKEIQYWSFCDPKYQKTLPNGEVVITSKWILPPTYWIKVTGPGGSKIIHDDIEGSEKLHQLEAMIDTISGDMQWIGGPNDSHS
jgi:hypothetical protein